MMSKCTVSPRMAPARSSGAPSTGQRSGRARRRASRACRRSARRPRPLSACRRRPGPRSCLPSLPTVPGRCSSEAARRRASCAPRCRRRTTKRRQRHFDEIRIAVELVAVGVRELGTFDQRVDEVGARRVDLAEIELLHQRELLQHRRPLAPDTAFADGVVAVFERCRGLDARLPARHVVSRQHAAVALAAGVHHLLRAAERVDRLGDEALATRFCARARSA